MTDPDIDQLARAAGTTTASPFDEPAGESLFSPLSNWLAGLLMAIIFIACIGLAVITVVAPWVLASLKT